MNKVPGILIHLCLLLLVVLVCAPGSAWAIKKKPQAKEAESNPECKALLLMDLASGEILQEKNIHESLPPASMVKIMLSYVTLKKVHDGLVKFADPITVSSHCSKI